MKALWTLSIFLVLIFFSRQAEAINGTNLIGFGPASRAMGGIGIGQPVGVDAVIKNPAFIRAEKELDVLVGMTHLFPSVKVENKNAGTLGGVRKEVESEADHFIAPAFGISKNINDKWAFGIGAFGVSGLGVDFRDARENGVFALHTDLSLFKVAPGVSYKHGDFYVGANLSILHGKFALAYSLDATNFTGPGASSDTGYGFDLGAG
ncbi:MAG: hypothetical protein HN509_10775, partial [Halobacteriovoraceae bacterium]|nr:hypothetical protein [Halobacteriovoraceae bacterium]